jgi:oligoendopeptidase F
MKWNLDDIVKIDEWEKLFAEVEADFEVYKKLIENPDVKMSEEKFKKIIDFGEELENKTSRLGGLPRLILAVDTKNQEARLMITRVQDLGLKMAEYTIKFSHWLKGPPVGGLDDENAKRLFGSISDLTYALRYGRKAAKHTLKENEEKIIMNKDVNFGSALDDLRDLISTEFRYEILGKKIETQSELMAYVYSSKSEERKAAYEALLTTQKKNIDKFFVMYQAEVKDWGYEAKLRNYKSPISVRNFGNEIDDEVIETLLEVTKKNKEIFYKYFEAKAKKLGEKKLNRMDLYAPVETDPPAGGGFEEAKKIVLETFEEFSHKFAGAAKQIIDKQHIDVFPDKNKTSGAFCATLNNKIEPYVMLNWTGKARDIATLAHELGHGVHSIYANKHYSSVQSAGLPLAETASTLGEMLIFEKFKKEMLWDKIADMYATILRQNYFIMFEIEAHKAISKGITEKDLSQMYFDNLKDQFGESLILPDDFRYEWSYISHIFESPFYCYAYNFGELLTLALYKRYKENKSEGRKVIEAILEAGGCENPNLLLNKFGIDIKSPKFWQNSFDIVQELVKELE